MLILPAGLVSEVHAGEEVQQLLDDELQFQLSVQVLTAVQLTHNAAHHTATLCITADNSAMYHGTQHRTPVDHALWNCTPACHTPWKATPVSCILWDTRLVH